MNAGDQARIRQMLAILLGRGVLGVALAVLAGLVLTGQPAIITALAAAVVLTLIVTRRQVQRWAERIADAALRGASSPPADEGELQG